MRVAALATLLLLPMEALAQATPVDPCRGGWTAWDWRECQMHLSRDAGFPEVPVTPWIRPAPRPPRESDLDRVLRESREARQKRCRRQNRRC